MEYKLLNGLSLITRFSSLIWFDLNPRANKQACLKCSFLVCLALLMSVSATNSWASEDDQESEENRLEIITVTAQKRVQNQQKVPVPVTAISSEEIAQDVIKDLVDLHLEVPWLGIIGQGGTETNFTVRGLGTSNQNIALEPSVGLYVDGVYRARQSALVNNLVDVQAVEVLRGPQGTLFGKNTPSGALLINTVQPGHDGDGFAELTIGDFGLINYAAARSISAVPETLAFRVTAFGNHRDGVISDTLLGEDTVNDRNRWGVRLQSLYTPSDDLSLKVIADFGELDEICCGAPTFLSNNTIGAAGLPGTDTFLPLFGGTVFPGGEAFFNREIAVNFLPIAKVKDRGLSAEWNWDISDRFSFVSLSAIRKFDTFEQGDADFTDAPLIGLKEDVSQRSFSQEFRLHYAGDRLNYVLGLFYFTQDLDLDFSIYTDTLFNEFFVANSGLQPLIDGINGVSVVSGGLIPPVAVAAPAGTNFDHVALQDHESYAVFGQLDYQLSDEWLLTTGLRYTQENKDLHTVYSETGPGINGLDLNQNNWADPLAALQVLTSLATNALDLTTPEGVSQLAPLAPFSSPGWAFPLVSPVTQPRPPIEATLDDDQLTGNVKLSYLPNENTLIYVSYGTGFKSGGTNTDRIQLGFNPVFGAETSATREVGLKLDLPEHNLRVNLAAHDTVVEDFQTNGFVGTGFNLLNAGSIELQGIELETVWLPTDELQVELRYQQLEAIYGSFDASICWVASPWHLGIDDPGRLNPEDPFCNRTGQEIGGPDYNAVLKVRQDLNLFDNTYAYFETDAMYTPERDPGDGEPLSRLDAFFIINARLFISLDEYDIDVVLWGRNIFDGEDVQGLSNAPFQEGKLIGFVGEPSTYGISIRKHF